VGRRKGENKGRGPKKKRGRSVRFGGVCPSERKGTDRQVDDLQKGRESSTESEREGKEKGAQVLIKVISL